jgi:hypothetical protein
MHRRIISARLNRWQPAVTFFVQSLELAGAPRGLINSAGCNDVLGSVEAEFDSLNNQVGCGRGNS